MTYLSMYVRIVIFNHINYLSSDSSSNINFSIRCSYVLICHVKCSLFGANKYFIIVHPKCNVLKHSRIIYSESCVARYDYTSMSG